jgi:hypothetical protein
MAERVADGMRRDAAARQGRPYDSYGASTGMAADS